MPDDVQLQEPSDEEGEYQDFDEAVAPPPRFKVKGRVYELPVDPPAEPILRAIREGKIDEGDPEELLKLMLPAEHVQQMFADGVGLIQMGRIAEWLATKVFKFAKAAGADGEGEAATPPSASATSSNGGRRSRRTSSATTKPRR